MPEALAIVAVFAIAAGVYCYAWLQARNPALQNSEQDEARLRHQATWLQDRLRLAQRENWDAAMIATLRSDLEVTARQLAASQLHE